jgi:hypothetical protein
MIFSHTQLSHFLQCPRKYRYRYIDGWQERESRAVLLFGRAFEAGLAAYFEGRDPAIALFDAWSKFRDLPLEYTRGDSWQRLGRQGVQLLERFAQQNRVHIANPKIQLQVPMRRRLASGDEFVAYIDGLGEVDGQYSLLEWKTSMSSYPEAPEGILALDPQLICYSWMTGISEIVLIAFLRRRFPDIQYLKTTIRDQQRDEFEELVESTIQHIREGQFLPHGGIRFPQESCLSCPYIGLCLRQPDLVERHLARKPEAAAWDWIYELQT